MEISYGSISPLITITFTSPDIKTTLMSTREIINRSIIIAFMILVGFALAQAFYYKSFMGIVLALVALGAGVYFLYILVKAKQELQALRAEGETDETT
jgi:hypothetical protein